MSVQVDQYIPITHTPKVEHLCVLLLFFGDFLTDKESSQQYNKEKTKENAHGTA